MKRNGCFLSFLSFLWMTVAVLSCSGASVNAGRVRSSASAATNPTRKTNGPPVKWAPHLSTIEAEIEKEMESSDRVNVDDERKIKTLDVIMKYIEGSPFFEFKSARPDQTGAHGWVDTAWIGNEPGIDCATSAINCTHYAFKRLNPGRDMKALFAGEAARYVYIGQHPYPWLPNYFGSIRQGEDGWMLVLELAAGDLLSLANENEHDTAQIFREAIVQIAEGLAQLHGLGLAHRDVKPDNILYKKVAGGGFSFMLGDLGDVSPDDPRAPLAVEGTAFYANRGESNCISKVGRFFGHKQVGRSYEKIDNETTALIQELPDLEESDGCIKWLKKLKNKGGVTTSEERKLLLIGFIDGYRLTKADSFAFAQLMMMLWVNAKNHRQAGRIQGAVAEGGSEGFVFEASVVLGTLKGRFNLPVSDEFSDVYKHLADDDPARRWSIDRALPELRQLAAEM